MFLTTVVPAAAVAAVSSGPISPLQAVQPSLADREEYITAVIPTRMDFREWYGIT
jgi:hypothetical protein